MPVIRPLNLKKGRNVVGTTTRRANTRVSSAERKEWLLFALLVGPNLFLFSVFTYWPLLYNGYLSMVRWDFLGPKVWVGLDNFTHLFTQDDFNFVLWNTFVFTVSAVGLICGLGLAVALLLNRSLLWRDGVRAVVFSPVMLSGAAMGIVWLFILDPRYGLLDILLNYVGLESPNWFLDTRWAMAGVIVVHVWKNLGYAVVIILAGLQAIPRELYEAALVDGAGAWGRFRAVTLPGLSPIFFFLFITTMLASFQSFDIIHVMTEGGPVNATTTLIYNLYDEAFKATRAGRAAVSAVVLFLGMFAITLVQMRFSERRVHYA